MRVFRLMGGLLLVVCLATCNFVNLNESPLHLHRRLGAEAEIRHDYVEAEKQFVTALNLAKQNGVENADFVGVAGELANVLSFESKDAQAEALYRERIEIADRIWNDEPERQQFVYSDLAIFYLLRDKVIQARPIYLRSLELTEKAYGPEDNRVAVVLDYFAVLLRAKNHTQEASAMEAQIKTIRAKHGSHSE